jgi:uncharacterized membrane protein
MSGSNNKRILFLDMMRALAVLMMVEGHTVDALLSDAYRDLNSSSYNAWLFVRGLTAPIFMFTSGVVFTYLLRLKPQPFFQNPRVRKGLIRFVTLVVIAYFLRYPTFTVFDFNFVTHEQWMGFFTVDALHLIGFGLLFILILSYISERLKIKDWIVYLSGVIFFFGLFSFTETIPWTTYLPIPFAAYFYHGTGSLFPFFPWAGFVLCGAILGSYLAHHPGAFTSKIFGLGLFYIGVGSLSVAVILNLMEYFYFEGDVFLINNIALILIRLGLVLVLNGTMSLIALKLKGIPEIFNQAGRHTLLIYAVHVIIIYGSAWLPGFDMILHKKLNVIESSIAAVIMISLMLAMVHFWEKYKAAKKNKLASAEN